MKGKEDQDLGLEGEICDLWACWSFYSGVVDFGKICQKVEVFERHLGMKFRN